MEFDKIHFKEVTSTWPDMHSFWRFYTLEPEFLFFISLWKAYHVFRFDDLKEFNCSMLWIIDKIGPILGQICRRIRILVLKCKIFKTIESRLHPMYCVQFIVNPVKIEFQLRSFGQNSYLDRGWVLKYLNWEDYDELFDDQQLLHRLEYQMSYDWKNRFGNLFRKNLLLTRHDQDLEGNSKSQASDFESWFARFQFVQKNSSWFENFVSDH